LILPQDASQPQQIMCRFADADTMLATYPSGETLQWKRLKGDKKQEKPSRPPEPHVRNVALGALVSVPYPHGHDIIDTRGS